MTPEELQAAKRAEARDPSTKPERLLALAQFHLQDVLQNPALPLLLMEQPDFGGTFLLTHRGRLVPLASSPAFPVGLASWALCQPFSLGLEDVLWRNESLPASVRRAALLRVRGNPLAPEVPAHAQTTWANQRPLVAELLSEAELALLDRAMALEVSSEAELGQLAELGLRGRQLAVRQPQTSVALLDQLASTADGEELFMILNHRNVDPARLVDALNSKDSLCRQWAASHIELTPDRLGPLERQGYMGMHLALAQNPTLPVETMRAWAHPRADSVTRAGLALNGSLPADLQLLLAADPSRDVRTTLRRNPILTPEARQKLEETDAQAKGSP